MFCENCSVEHEGSYGSGRFCSSRCARGFSTKTDRREISAKVSKKLYGRHTGTGNPWSEAAKARVKAAQIERRKIEFQHQMTEAAFEELSRGRKRLRILNEQDFRCAICSGAQSHNGKHLDFDLDHIDGDRTNNSRENLRLICPNCHRQTETWGSRNASG